MEEPLAAIPASAGLFVQSPPSQVTSSAANVRSLSTSSTLERPREERLTSESTAPHSSSSCSSTPLTRVQKLGRKLRPLTITTTSTQLLPSVQEYKSLNVPKVVKPSDDKIQEKDPRISGLRTSRYRWNPVDKRFPLQDPDDVCQFVSNMSRQFRPGVPIESIGLQGALIGTEDRSLEPKKLYYPTPPSSSRQKTKKPLKAEGASSTYSEDVKIKLLFNYVDPLFVFIETVQALKQTSPALPTAAAAAVAKADSVTRLYELGLLKESIFWHTCRTTRDLVSHLVFWYTDEHFQQTATNMFMLYKLLNIDLNLKERFKGNFPGIDFGTSTAMYFTKFIKLYHGTLGYTLPHALADQGNLVDMDDLVKSFNQQSDVMRNIFGNLVYRLVASRDSTNWTKEILTKYKANPFKSLLSSSEIYAFRPHGPTNMPNRPLIPGCYWRYCSDHKTSASTSDLVD